jgi:hypothetical protein
MIDIAFFEVNVLCLYMLLKNKIGSSVSYPQAC